MKIKKSLWLCIRECSIEISKDGTHNYYSAGEIIEDSQKPNEHCFLHISTQQARELSKILKCIQKEKAYQEKQRLAIHNAHPRVNWKATQRLNGSIQEARSMRKRFNNIVSEIAGKDIEVLCMIHRKYQTYTIARYDGETWWQPVIPITALEYGGWIGINEEIIAWREIHEK